MHATDADHLTCLSCGYDLRAAGGADEKCPECGFAVRDSMIGHTRAAGRWAWKVRLGIVLMLAAVPFGLVEMLTYTQLNAIGMPLTALNFPGPKVWGGPLTRMWGEGKQEAMPVLVALVLNGVGIYLLTTPAAAAREPPMSLRRWLRVYATAAVPTVWFFATPWYGWPRFPGQGAYHAFVALLVIEVPATTLLYLYLAHLARQRLRDPQLAKRQIDLLKGIIPLQLLGILAVTQLIPMRGPQNLVVTVVYGGFALCLALWAVDLFLDFYRALGEIEPHDRPG
jgi:predicted RNA-binding Zn-ribbon protein involved in translation (DUF1610 family)